MSAAAWHIRPYRPGDERALVALWSEAFNRPMTEEHWRWKAKGRPAPIENVGVAVAADDRPIFQFVGIPCPAIVLGQPRTVMIGADVVTDPRFRRRGVFTATVRRLFDTWREAGVALVLGLANDRWGSRAEALGYERTFQLRWLTRPLRPERILARKARVPRLARLQGLGDLWNRVWDWRATAAPDITVRALASATDEIEAIWKRGSGHVATSLVRDRAWVTWRYERPPEHHYCLTLAERAGTPAGYAVYRVARTEGRTVVRVPEIFAPGDGMVLRALVRDLVARAVAADAESVVTLSVRGSSTDRELRRAGFLFSPGAYRLEMVRLDTAIPATALRDPHGWWLTGGDFDVI